MHSTSTAPIYATSTYTIYIAAYIHCQLWPTGAISNRGFAESRSAPILEGIEEEEGGKEMKYLYLE